MIKAQGNIWKQNSSILIELGVSHIYITTKQIGVSLIRIVTMVRKLANRTKRHANEMVKNL